MIPVNVHGIGSWWDSMRVAARDYAELHERRALLRRPWEEEFLHWALEPDGWRLHGRVPPPNARRTYGATRTGWCIALRDRSRPH